MIGEVALKPKPGRSNLTAQSALQVLWPSLMPRLQAGTFFRRVHLKSIALVGG